MNLIAALKYWHLIVTIVREIEAVAADLPGAQKLEAALAAILKVDD